MNVFDVDKAVQAAGVIFDEEGCNNLEYLRLLKLLYIAERELIRQTARSFLNDVVFAMDHGPVMDRMYGLLKEQANRDEWLSWSHYFSRCDRYAVCRNDNPGVGKLSRREVETLRRVTRERIGVDQWEIVEEVHKFEEWKAHYQGPKTSTRIPLRSIFEALGIGDQYGPAMNAAREEAVMDKFFGQGQPHPPANLEGCNS